MSYVIYADIILLWIFVINYLTYSITCILTNHKLSQLKLLLWSILSAVILELLYLLILNNKDLIYKSIYISTNIILIIIFIKYILKIKSTNGLTKILIYNILGTLLIAGIIQIFIINEPSLQNIIPLIIIICIIIPIIHHMYPINIFQKQNLHNVIISTKQFNIKTIGFYDTGNSLRDIYSGKPVIIVEYTVLKKLLNSNQYDELYNYIKTGCYQHICKLKIDGEMLRLIPYKTISNDYSMMPVFHLKSITINNKIYEDIVAGISSCKLSRDLNFKVLLNNNL